MESGYIESYKGYEIRVVVLPSAGIEDSYRAIYEAREIANGEATPIKGVVVATAFTTAEEAQKGALEVARLSIDHQIGNSEIGTKHKVEVFSAGCPCCVEAISLVEKLASRRVEVLDMHDPAVARRARELGVRSVPAVAIDGRLADCCAGRAVDEQALRAAGLGQL